MNSLAAMFGEPIHEHECGPHYAKDYSGQNGELKKPVPARQRRTILTSTSGPLVSNEHQHHRHALVSLEQLAFVSVESARIDCAVGSMLRRTTPTLTREWSPEGVFAALSNSTILAHFSTNEVHP